jgi:hypothetical protein
VRVAAAVTRARAHACARAAGATYELTFRVRLADASAAFVQYSSHRTQTVYPFASSAALATVQPAARIVLDLLQPGARPAAVEAQFVAGGARVRVRFDSPMGPATGPESMAVADPRTPCFLPDFFTNETVAQMGTDAKCAWLGPHAIVALLGADASLVVGSVLHIAPSGLVLSVELERLLPANLSLRAPVAVSPPAISLLVPGSPIAHCVPLLMRAIVSDATSLPPTVQWSVLAGTTNFSTAGACTGAPLNVSALSAFVDQSPGGPELTVPTNLLCAGCCYSLKATATNAFGAQSAAPFTIRLTPLAPLPVLSIVGAPSSAALTSQDYEISAAIAQLPLSCEAPPPVVENFTWLWTLTADAGGGTVFLDGLSSRTARLLLERGTVVLEGSYTLTVTAAVVNGTRLTASRTLVFRR